mmetsp:Transcript_12717/g.15589  ORF Transcript_12717/g.15589 Transcript_12717/m.15589 type:complete len:515 (+) Transcript_12717:97-1641(+)
MTVSEETYILLNEPSLAIVPTITGSISAISSSLIIYLIYNSERRLCTIYHRIMFAMSCADVLASVAMALSTIPMPNAPICEIDEDRWDTLFTLGNLQTCKVQGFFILFGLNCMYAYNGMLCIYYTCAIAFRMKEDTIKKRVEPFLHLFPIIVSLAVSIPPLYFNLYHATENDAWCMVATHPCFEVAPSGAHVLNVFVYWVLPVEMISLMITLLTCNTLIIRGAWKIDKELQCLTTNTSIQVRSIIRHEEMNDPFKTAVSNHQTTKVIIKQSLAYCLALMITLLFPFIRICFGDTTRSDLIEIPRLVFMPLQGFLNFLIFIGHKVYNARRVEPDKSYSSILCNYFCGHRTLEPVLLSRISLVHFLDESDNVEINYDDENGHNLLQLEMPRRSIASRTGGNDVIVDENSSNRLDLSGFDDSTGINSRDFSRDLSYASHAPQSSGDDAVKDEDSSKLDFNDFKENEGVDSCGLSYPSMSHALKSSGNDVLIGKGNNSSLDLSGFDDNIAGFDSNKLY